MPNIGFLLRCTKPSSELEKKTSYVCKLSPEFVVGCAEESSLFLPHPTVSKIHCTFTYHADNQLWSIQDKSLLGTWVNKRRLPQEADVPLGFGDFVKFGPTNKFIYKFRSYQSEGGGSTSGGGTNNLTDTKMESEEVRGRQWGPKTGRDEASADTPSTTQAGSSGAGPSSTRQSPVSKRPYPERYDPSLGKRPATGLSPLKRQRSLTPEETRQAQLKEVERLEKKETFLENQLRYQLEQLAKKYHAEKQAIIEQQKRLADELHKLEANHQAEELELQKKNCEKLTTVRRELSELRMSLEGNNRPLQSSSSTAPDNNPPGPSTSTSPATARQNVSHPDSAGWQSEAERALLQRLEQAERERDALIRQLQAARGEAHLGDEPADQLAMERLVADTQRERDCAPGRVVEDDTVTSSTEVQVPSEAEEAEEAKPPSTEGKNEEEKKDTERMGEQEKEVEQDAVAKLKNIGILVEEELQCSICNELIVAAVTINCAHSFCKYCLGEWKKQRAECPMCRMAITAEHRSVTLDSLINTMVGQLGPEIQQRHQEVVAERAARDLEQAAAAATAAGNRQGPPPGNLPVVAQDVINQAGRGPRPHHNHHYHHNNNHNFNNNMNNWNGQPAPHLQPHMHAGHHVYPGPPHAHPPHAHPPHAHPPHAHPPLAHPPHAHPPHAHPPHAHPPHAHPPHAHLPHAHAVHAHPPPHGHQPHPHAPHAHPAHAHPAPANPGPANPGPARHNTPPPGHNTPPAPDSPEFHLRVRRRNGRNIISSGSSSGSSSEEPSDSQTSYSSSGGFSSASDRSWFESDYMSAEYDDDEPDFVPGIPGRYYGGFGECFYCHNRGHWSNGCPFRQGGY